MRLLRIEASGNLCLTKPIYGNTVPPYAILSHTWGEDEEEVTLQDLQADRGDTKPGYQKLLFCRQQARRDGLQHFWVDTCCIDKTNLVELQEAINSMCKWYNQSSRCYALLSDIDSDLHPLQPFPLESVVRSRWFTRGWTLQELIAPSSVEFFDKNGVALGTRSQLQPYITKMTQIPAEILNGAPLESTDVNSRYLWAKGRNTKRPEDRAYSLLGIFGVCMPLLYGEGTIHAFERLEREIRIRANERASANNVSVRVQTILQMLSGSSISEGRESITASDNPAVENGGKEASTWTAPAERGASKRSSFSSDTSYGHGISSGGSTCPHCGYGPTGSYDLMCPNCGNSL